MSLIKYRNDSGWADIVLSIENGGTGATTQQAAQYNIINNLAEAVNDSNVMQDGTKIGGIYKTPTKENGSLYYMQGKQLWNYINTKLNTVEVTNGVTKGNGLDNNYTGTFNAGQLCVGEKVKLYTNTEGGNIRIISPSGITYEFDAYNGDLRVWGTNGTGGTTLFTLKYSDGSLALSGSLGITSGGTGAKTANQALKNLGIPKVYTGYKSDLSWESGYSSTGAYAKLFTEAEFNTITGHSYDPKNDIIIINAQQGHSGYYTGTLSTAAYHSDAKCIYIDARVGSSQAKLKVNYTIITWTF